MQLVQGEFHLTGCTEHMHLNIQEGTPDSIKVFNKAMINHTTIIINRILERYKGFEHFKTLVDVGGGLRITLGVITTKYPSLKGINFDLPYVIQRAPTYLGMVLAFFHFLLTSVFHLASLPTK